MATRLEEVLIPNEAAENTPERCQAIFNTIFAMAAAVESDSTMHFTLLDVCASLQRRDGHWTGKPSPAQSFRTLLDFGMLFDHYANLPPTNL